MAIRDIMPLNPDEWEIMHFALDAAAAFVEGEAVALNAAGEVQEMTADSATENEFLGIAAASGDTVGATSSIGSFRYPSLGDFDPTGGVLPVAGDLVPVWVPKQNGARLITSNFGATAFNVVPLQTHIGDAEGLEAFSGSWGVSTGATTDMLRIVDVLDDNHVPITLSGGTGVYVVAAVTNSALTAAGPPTAPVAD